MHDPFSARKTIAVVGSSNVDLIMKMDRLPRVGESVPDAVFYQTFGGKGANQAVAAARAGGEVIFVTCVGEDDYGLGIIENMKSAHIDVEHVFRGQDVATGTALIMIGGKGENYLSVAPGANYRLTAGLVERCLSKLRTAALVMLQAEIPLETVAYTIKQAADDGCQIMFNVAPAHSITNIPLHLVDWLVVNETEASFLTDLSVENETQAWQAAEALRAKGARTVILTLGAQGCICLGRDLREKVPAYCVEAVDTTAAGDVFCGAMATALVEGKSMRESLQFASAAAAIAVTRLGAQPSIPEREEIERFLHM
jgi:ribokinase